MKTVRSDILKKAYSALAGIGGFGLAASADEDRTKAEAVSEIANSQDIPMFSGYTRLGNLVFVSGRGDRLEGDIKVHTDNVLKEIGRAHV